MQGTWRSSRGAEGVPAAAATSSRSVPSAAAPWPVPAHHRVDVQFEVVPSSPGPWTQRPRRGIYRRGGAARTPSRRGHDAGFEHDFSLSLSAERGDTRTASHTGTSTRPDADGPRSARGSQPCRLPSPPRENQAIWQTSTHVSSTPSAAGDVFPIRCRGPAGPGPRLAPGRTSSPVWHCCPGRRGRKPGEPHPERSPTHTRRRGEGAARAWSPAARHPGPCAHCLQRRLHQAVSLVQQILACLQGDSLALGGGVPRGGGEAVVPQMKAPCLVAVMQLAGLGKVAT